MDSKNPRKATGTGLKKLTKRKIDSKLKRNIMTNGNHKNSPASQLRLNHSTTYCRGEESRKKLVSKPALRKYHEVKQENIRSREQHEQRLKEARIARQKYDQKKLHRNRKLLAKTSKGQPIMKNRVEILLEKIRSSMVNK